MSLFDSLTWLGLSKASLQRSEFLMREVMTRFLILVSTCAWLFLELFRLHDHIQLIMGSTFSGFHLISAVTPHLMRGQEFVVG